ncbi:enoyl-CoA hydratase/isomerase family protein [Sphingomonas sp. LaA6.9]|uniref:enoyl-CoA hydratase/isomerase family protein n=1 Tax=Sphingomonas sp. LaA6.9 TaxID=2919914 RepID=UPI001F4FC413|nr:enoyl-CoA hydratase/isomerase family protein [Sphingomonas sp. LaA6.9]MCJ8156029.1 enoyl-CoA hydratase/isomerase family protein [Sphingomonas sp. LaA6.9]
MTTSDFLIEPRTLVLPWADGIRPLGVIDLDVAGDDVAPIVHPPFPLIGVGDSSHPLAAQLDAIVEPPVASAALIENVCGQPEAALVVVQLLRLIEQLDPAQALVAESMAYGLLQSGRGHAGWMASCSAEPMPPGKLLVTRNEDVLDIGIERPDANNAIDCELRDALREAFELAVLDPGIGRIVLRGVGKVFSVGADLAEFGTTRDPVAAHVIRTHTLPAHAIVRCAEKLEVHVQGGCVGSALEMAAFARRITASSHAWFHLPELAMGVLPGAGGCVSVSRRIGRQRAALMILSGRRISADTALDWGLIDAIVGD